MIRSILRVFIKYLNAEFKNLCKIYEGENIINFLEYIIQLKK